MPALSCLSVSQRFKKTRQMSGCLRRCHSALDGIAPDDRANALVELAKHYGLIDALKILLQEPKSPQKRPAAGAAEPEQLPNNKRRKPLQGVLGPHTVVTIERGRIATIDNFDPISKLYKLCINGQTLPGSYPRTAAWKVTQSPRPTTQRQEPAPQPPLRSPLGPVPIARPNRPISCHPRTVQHQVGEWQR